MNYYLGVDIGTTSTKVLAFSPSGEVVTQTSVAYEMHHPQSGWSEQDPEEIWNAVTSSINKVVKELAPHPPSFVSFSAAMHSILAVDEKGKALTPCIIWADNRADSIAEGLRNSDQGYFFYQATGVPIHSMSPLCKLLWLKESEPDLFHSASKFIGLKEYVFYKLFGVFVVDTSVASATGLLNIKTLSWDDAVLRYLELDPSHLPRVVSSKEVLYYKEENGALTLPQDVPFVIGASDGALSNLGSGAMSAQTMAITIGTSGAARIVLTAPETDSRMRTFCYHLKDEYYIAGGATNNGAVVVQWLKDQLLQTSESYEDLIKQAATIAAGSEGLLLLPYILGERAPLWNSNARGVYFGLSISHTKAHLVRAAIEGIIYSLYSIGKIIAEKREITGIYASGGLAQNEVGLQILADVFNIKVSVAGDVESSALGAVLLGAEAMNLPMDPQNKVLAEYHPVPENHKVYKGCFEKFERLYEILKEEMSDGNTGGPTEEFHKKNGS
jgi:gluconokinase